MNRAAEPEHTLKGGMCCLPADLQPVFSPISACIISHDFSGCPIRMNWIGILRSRLAFLARSAMLMKISGWMYIFRFHSSAGITSQAAIHRKLSQYPSIFVIRMYGKRKL